DLDVRGVVAIAPATDLGVLLPGAAAVPAFSGFAVAAAYGWSSAYGDAPLDTILTDDAIEKATVLERECLSGVLAAYASDPPGAVFHTSPLAVPVWKRHLDENSPGQKPSATPILVVQGGRDELVPAGVTSNWVRGRACA